MAAVIAGKDDAGRKRILDHMNADHSASIARYLEHYSGVSRWEASSGRMVDISLNNMTLLTKKGRREQLSFSPALTSYAQARERLVELDKNCIKALGRSDVTVNKFISPTSSIFNTINFITLGAIIACPRKIYEDGEIVSRVIGAPQAQFAWRIQPYVWWFLVVAHIIESALFTSTLQKHSANPRSASYWLWCATTLIEGFPAGLRFNRHVKKAREAREKQKH